MMDSIVVDALNLDELIILEGQEDNYPVCYSNLRPEFVEYIIESGQSLDWEAIISLGNEFIDVMNRHVDFFLSRLRSGSIPVTILPELPIEDIERLSPEFGYQLDKIVNDCYLLYRLCTNPNITMDFIHSYRAEIIRFDLWPTLAAWFRDPVALYQTYKQYINISRLAHNSNLTPELALQLPGPVSCIGLSIDFMLQHNLQYLYMEHHPDMTIDVYKQLHPHRIVSLNARSNLLRQPRIRCLDLLKHPDITADMTANDSLSISNNPNLTPEFVFLAFGIGIEGLVAPGPFDLYELYPLVFSIQNARSCEMNLTDYRRHQTQLAMAGFFDQN